MHHLQYRQCVPGVEQDTPQPFLLTPEKQANGLVRVHTSAARNGEEEEEEEEA